MTAERSRGGVSLGGFGLESLEARVVLASVHDLAVVGMTYNPTDGYVPYAAELVWAEDRTVSGGVWTTGATGPVGPVPTSFTDLINAPDGAVVPFLSSTPATGIPAMARFIADEGYPVGWIGGMSGAGSSAKADIAAVVERAADATAADLVGNWSFQMTHISAAGVFTRLGLCSCNSAGGFFSLATGATGDQVWAGEGFEFAGDPDNGRFDIGLGKGDTAVMYLSADKSILLIADMDRGDGDAWMGIGLRQGFEVTAAEAVGSYRVGVLYEGQDAVEGANMSDLDDGAPGFAARLDLNADGSFKLFEMEAADRHDFSEPTAAGPWAIDDGIVTLADSESGITIVVELSANGVSGIVQSFTQTDPVVSERPMSVVTKIIPGSTEALDTVFPAGILDPDGLPLVFDLREESDTWFVVDFDRYARHDLTYWMDETLGATPGDIEAFQASDGRLLAAVTTDDGLFVMERDDNGFWRSRNLTDTLTGAENIVSTITVFQSRPKTGAKVSFVAGLTETGDMVAYEFDPTAGGGAGAWSYTNISAEHLIPQGEKTPEFVGPIMSYVTSWNGLNIAGLAADGSIRAVWTGNGGQQWYPANLTVSTGAPPLASGLTAFLTSWGGINIVGLDGAGRMLAAWWVPGFEGDWELADLTAASGGPTLTGDSLTSFFAPWGALNIVGIDAQGDLQAYWWTPSTDKWQVANLTADIPTGQPKPASQLQGQANLTHGGELNVLGTDADTGELLRLFFRVEDDAWAVQNVSSEAEWV